MGFHSKRNIVVFLYRNIRRITLEKRVRSVVLPDNHRKIQAFDLQALEECVDQLHALQEWESLSPDFRVRPDLATIGVSSIRECWVLYGQVKRTFCFVQMTILYS